MAKTEARIPLVSKERAAAQEGGDEAPETTGGMQSEIPVVSMAQSVEENAAGVLERLAAGAKQIRPDRRSDEHAWELLNAIRNDMLRLGALSQMFRLFTKKNRPDDATRKNIEAILQPLECAHDWDRYLHDVLPAMLAEDQEFDQEASLQRARRRADIAFVEACGAITGERFHAAIESFREELRSMESVMEEMPEKKIRKNLRSALLEQDHALRDRISDVDGPRVRRSTRHRVDNILYGFEALSGSGITAYAESYVKSLFHMQRALERINDLLAALALGDDVCVSVRTGLLARKKSRKACTNLLREAMGDVSSACRRFLRRSSIPQSAEFNKDIASLMSAGPIGSGSGLGADVLP